MRSTVLASCFALAASVSALQITFPASQNASIDLSQSNTITWDTVVSDPATVRIDLVNRAVNPSVSLTVAEKVSTADKKYDMQPQKGVKTGQGYQINFVAIDDKNSGLIAQSNQFTVSKSAANDTTPTQSQGSGATPSQTGPAATTSAAKNAAGNLNAWGGAGVLALFAAFLL